MERKYALFFSLILTLIIASNIYIFERIDLSPKNNRESVIISKTIDGDTLILEDGRKLRLLNINTPEKKFYGYELASNFLKKYENKTVEVEITSLDKYSRSLARVYTPEYLNLKIVSEGLANTFLVQKSELKEFKRAEELAINQFLGIWKRSKYYGCFNINIEKDAEFVEIINLCSNINMAGWITKDESTKTYKFPAISLDSIRLHSSSGKDNNTDLFWNSKINVWNSDRDSLYLFDSQGNLAHYESYGY